MDWLGAAMVKHYKGDDGDMKLLLEAVASAFAGLPPGAGLLATPVAMLGYGRIGTSRQPVVSATGSSCSSSTNGRRRSRSCTAPEWRNACASCGR